MYTASMLMFEMYTASMLKVVDNYKQISYEYFFSLNF